MFFNGRLASLRLRPRHVSYLLKHTACQSQQRRTFNEFIARAPEPRDISPGSFRLAVKDNIATADLPTTCASDILSNHVSPYDATIVRQLKARGAVVVGKTNLDEFGMGSHSTNSVFGAVHNTGALAGHSAGGSSGGSAVAVRSGAAQIGLGTDTGGSIRLPAAYTGTVGYKPSYGMISRFGVVPYANSLDTVGFLAREVQPIWELVNEKRLYAEHDPKDPTSLSDAARKRCTKAREYYVPEGTAAKTVPGDHILGSMTFGIPLEYNIEELDPRIRAAWTRIGERVQELGARVVPVSLPSTRHALSAYYVIAPAEASSNLAKYDGVRYGKRSEASDGAGEVLYSETRGAGFGDEVKRRILLGSYTLSSEAMDNYFIQAQKVRQLVRRDFDRVFALANPLHDEEHFDLSEMDDSELLENKFGPTQVDFLLCPTAPTLPPTLEAVLDQTPLDAYMNDVFTVPASLAGLPALSLPMKLTPDSKGTSNGEDVAGLQLIGQYWDDARLLAVAELLRKPLDT